MRCDEADGPRGWGGRPPCPSDGMVDFLVSEAGAERRAGSSPALGTLDPFGVHVAGAEDMVGLTRL